MNDVVYQVEHSVEVPVTPAFAWDWRTNIKNWDDPPAQFQLDGPFAAGSWGATRLPGQEPLRWQIRDVQLGKSFVSSHRNSGRIRGLTTKLSHSRGTPRDCAW